MGVQIHASGSSGGHEGPDIHQRIHRGSWGLDTRQRIQRESRGSRYTPGDPQGVTRVQIHASGSRGVTRVQIQMEPFEKFKMAAKMAI